jgi:hypothetical protein
MANSAMARATTEITTPKASYYLQMLCKHWAHKLPVEFTPERGRVPFPDGVGLMEAVGDTLKITIEAGDEGRVRHFEGVVINHLKRFAHSEDLKLDTVAWRDA